MDETPGGHRAEAPALQKQPLARGSRWTATMRAQAPPEQEKRLQDDLARGRSRLWAQLQLPRPVSERAATSSVRPHASPGEGDPFSFTESNVPPMELTTR